VAGCFGRGVSTGAVNEFQEELFVVGELERRREEAADFEWLCGVEGRAARTPAGA